MTISKTLTALTILIVSVAFASESDEKAKAKKKSGLPLKAERTVAIDTDEGITDIHILMAIHANSRSSDTLPGAVVG